MCIRTCTYDYLLFFSPQFVVFSDDLLCGGGQFDTHTTTRAGQSLQVTLRDKGDKIRVQVSIIFEFTSTSQLCKHTHI